MPDSRRSRDGIMRALSSRARARVYPASGLRVGRLWLDQGFALELHPSLPPAEQGALLRLFLQFTMDDGDARTTFNASKHAELVPLFDLVAGTSRVLE